MGRELGSMVMLGRKKKNGFVGPLCSLSLPVCTKDSLCPYEIKFLSLRKTLAAQMQSHHLFPAGTTYLLLRDADFHPDTLGTLPPRSTPDGSTRVFEVLKPEIVFGEVVFDAGMLRFVISVLCLLLESEANQACSSSLHLPQHYNQALSSSLSL